MRFRTAPVAAASAALLLAGCAATAGHTTGRTTASATSAPRSAAATPPNTPAEPTSHAHGSTPTAATAPEAPLRKGERFVTVRMPTAYSPKAPAAPGTDDYRCFLLDPGITRTSVVTGMNVLPGNPDVVHHVILFRVSPEAVARAERRDRQEAGQGWTCFGDSGIEGSATSLDSAPWLGAWAPGGGEQVLPTDLGMPLAAGSQIIMQVHYNLLAGRGPDISAAKMRVAPDDGSRKILHTMLLPAPVELPCRPGKTGALCSREAAVADVMTRFGRITGQASNALNLLCGPSGPGPTQTCTRPVIEAATIRASAGHMHLLGRSISVTVNEGRAGERVVLNLPVWDFDNQGSRPVSPAAKVTPGDTLTVRCTHDQSLRDHLPAFEGQPERYVVWGEGSTDEMCLGAVLVTRP